MAPCAIWRAAGVTPARPCWCGWPPSWLCPSPPCSTPRSAPAPAPVPVPPPADDTPDPAPVPEGPATRTPTRDRPTHAQAFGASQLREFGRRVRAARERVGWSQEKLAFVCDYHRSYAGNVERGAVNPSLYNLLRLATGLGIDPAELVRALGPVELPPSPLLRWMMTAKEEPDQP